MEVDNLEEIEALCSYTDEELLEQGADPDALDDAREQIDEMYDMTDKELKSEYGMSKTDAELFRDAVESGEEILEGEKEVTVKDEPRDVTASGSIIEDSKLKFVQSIVNQSTSKKPVYKVYLSYEWKSPYVMSLFNDKIAASWKGSDLTYAGENNKYGYIAPGGLASYYEFSTALPGGKYTKAYKSKHMSYTPASRNISFTFPQVISVMNNFYGSKDYRTKNGECHFVIYQTCYAGKTKKDAHFYSRYLHRTVTLDSVSISFTSSGITPGKAWQSTRQKDSIIKY
ncbi:MAG: hypothetical protein KBS74_07815 [Clostridiales bacterium]|nr:hypothetical protein [Candidatus Cacconaster stercorequi]